MANATGANGYEGVLGWAVGRQEWLNDPSSKVNRYWRAIEDGSTYWQNKTVVGLWGESAGTNSRPNSLINGQPMSRFGGGGQKFAPFFPRPHSGADMEKASRAALFYFFGGVVGRGGGPTRNLDLLRTGTQHRVDKHGWSKGAPDSLSEKKRMFFWFMTKATPEQMPFVRGKIGRPILPQHHYTKVAAGFPIIDTEMDLLRTGVETLMGGTLPKGKMTDARVRDAMRAAVAKDSNTGAKPKTGPVRGVTRQMPNVGLIHVSASPITQDNLRVGGGKFSHSYWRGMVVDVNRQMALLVQKEVVAAMQEQRTPRPATRDLIRAAADPRNITPR